MFKNSTINRRQFLAAGAMGASVAMGLSCAKASGAEANPVVSAAEANATLFGRNVYVFDPAMPAADIQDIVSGIFKKMETNQFGQERYALLFKPGTYRVTFNVGFYTHVAGLGQNPDQVQIDGGVNVNAKWANGMALVNFWRTLENYAVTPSSTRGITRFAVSQASPMRRLHVKGQLQLFDWTSGGGAGYASGGFMADSIVDGITLPASQQQWISRNSTWSKWANAVWNMVFVGCENTPSGTFPNPAYTVVKQTPVIREKPYLCIDSGGNYAVFAPSLQSGVRGPSWSNGNTPGKFIPLDQFYIAQPSTASAQSINAALAAGKNILFTPGVYRLTDTLKVTRANTILLGLGVPSLVATTGQAAISVADVAGVTIAGMIMDAGPVRSKSLLQVGPAAASANHSANPTFLYDLTVRTAGAFAGKNDVGVEINSNNVVVDNIWIWRADHGAGVGWKANATKHGLVVNGNDVICYGLFNEHHEEYQTLWNGNRGRVYMYQSEMPYDPPDQASWMAGQTVGYASYKVADGVTDHEAWGLGIYCFFRDAVITCQSAIQAPAARGVKLHHLTTVWLSGKKGSQIDHIVNRIGGRVYANTPASAMRQTLTEFGGTD